MLRVSRYRFGSTFRRHWGGYLALVLLVGLLGGLAMGTIAAARRTQSAFPTFLASTNPSDLTAAIFSGDTTGTPPLDVALNRRIAHLPHVKRLEILAGLNALPLGTDGAPLPLSVQAQAGVIPAGSLDGLDFDQDRPTVLAGRMADPKRPDEFVTSEEGARLLHLHVGDVLPVGLYSNAQDNSPQYGTAALEPRLMVQERLVGLVAFNTAIVQDDSDRLPTVILFTPALTRRAFPWGTSPLVHGLQLDHGSGDVATVEAEIQALGRLDVHPHATSARVQQAERAIKPESIALGVFGAVVALAVLLIAGLVIDRQLRRDADDLAALRALGASPTMAVGAALLGIVGAVLVGSLLAVAVAVGLSPLAPIGVVRPVYPTPGMAFDWTVLAGGLATLALGLGAVAVLLARREVQRSAHPHEAAPARTSRLAAAVSASGLSAPAVTGIRFAVDPGSSVDPAPVRSAILGAVLAMVIGTATLTFAASLHTLVSHPALYGWNWDEQLISGYGGGASMADPAPVLDHDPHVAAWSSVYFIQVRLDGQPVPTLGATPNADVGLAMLSGHALAARNQIVLGATTLAELHKRVGDTVEEQFGDTAPTRLKVVGTATMPSVGSFGAHLSMGTGALLASRLIPFPETDGQFPGPNAVFVRFRKGTDLGAARQRLEREAPGLLSSVLDVQRPAEIVNYRTMGTLPADLGAALAAGSVVALALTLIASVRRRRRDLALLRVLGFTRRQLAAVVAWQSTVAVAIGTVLGIPLGVALGRALWDLFAHELHVAPAPTVPVFAIALVTVGALVLANLIAAAPGLQAARTRTAVLLRAE